MKKIAFELKMQTVNEMQMKTRKTWGFNPASRSFKSIRDYNRRNTKAIERAAKQGLY